VAVFFEARDGTKLHGLLCKTGSDRAILACHGNAGNVEGRAGEIAVLASWTGANVLMFDYRGYGRSEGSPDEEGLCKDAQGALLALEQATGVPRQRTVVLGHSLGGAVAIDLARSTPGIGGVVTLSTFSTLADLIADLTFPGLSILCPESWDSLEKVREIEAPKLFVHGTADALIASKHSSRLFEAAPPPKTLFLVPGAGHNDILGPEALAEITRFVEASR
jgi:fermentation-respiration switch protein FrsA (DUF1100 family)